MEVDVFVPALNTCIIGINSKKRIQESNFFDDHSPLELALTPVIV